MNAYLDANEKLKSIYTSSQEEVAQDSLKIEGYVNSKDLFNFEDAKDKLLNDINGFEVKQKEL